MTNSRLDLSAIRRRSGDLDKLLLIGDADLATLSALRSALRGLIDDATVGAIVDVSLLGVLDHGVLGELLGARMRAASKGISLVVVCVDDRVFEWLERSGINELLVVSRTEIAT